MSCLGLKNISLSLFSITLYDVRNNCLFFLWKLRLFVAIAYIIRNMAEVESVII